MGARSISAYSSGAGFPIFLSSAEAASMLGQPATGVTEKKEAAFALDAGHKGQKTIELDR